MRFFTSDTHFGHARILELSNRPFADVDEMNEAIIANWNAVVARDDIVFHLGDVALGKIADSLPLVSRLNGYKILVNGNHDRPFMERGKRRYDEWVERYSEVFQVVVTTTALPIILSDGTEVILSHFPYTGDHTPEDRHTDARPVDEGIPLIHGHTHSTDIVTFSHSGTPQIHVGVDAWDFMPVYEDSIIDTLHALRT